MLDTYGLPAFVAAPGVETRPVTPHSAAGDRLLCVAAVLPHKGHDVLAEALAMLPDAGWTCLCVGSLERAPEFAAEVRGRAPAGMRFAGPRTGADLDAAYADADLLVVATFAVGSALQRAQLRRFGGRARSLPSNRQLTRQLVRLLS